MLVGRERQLLQLAQQRFEFRFRCRLGFVSQECGHTAKQRIGFGQGLHRIMGLRRQQHLILRTKQPIHKPLELARTHAGQIE